MIEYITDLLCFLVLLKILKVSVEIKMLHFVAFLFPPDAVRKVFIQLANSSFTGFPNLIKSAKVFFKFDVDILINM